MKIKVGQIKPNPYKKEINNGVLNKERIKMLKESMEKDGFWDNVLCRRKNGEFELAYGHHRIQACKEMYGDDHIIDIPCKDLSDENMIRILGNENSFQNEEFTVYQLDQIKATKKFLELCPSAGHTSKYRPKTGLTSEIGARQISEFLGEQNWSKTKVAELLQLETKLHPKILKEVKNVPNQKQKTPVISKSHAREIARIEDKDEQLKVYDNIKKHNLSKRETMSLVDNIKNTDKNIVKKPLPKQPTIESVVIQDIVKKLYSVIKIMPSIIKHKYNIGKQTASLLNIALEEMQELINQYTNGGGK